MNTHPGRTAPAAPAAGWALLAALCCSSPVMAESDWTPDQIYQAAQAGHVDPAQQRLQPVLLAPPDSAKARDTEAKLLARQGQASKARTELSTADRLTSGLPFARPEVVQNLRLEWRPATDLTRISFAPTTAYASPQSPPQRSLPWGVLWAIGGGALLACALMRLVRPVAGTGSAPALGHAPVAGSAPGSNPAYANTGPAAAPTAAPGIGSQLASGLATGLAVGAGVIAAEAIGKSLWAGDRYATGGFGLSPALLDEIRLDPIRAASHPNADMGGNDFGIQHAGTWDDDGAAAGDGDN
jgi:hypothetical protein